MATVQTSQSFGGFTMLDYEIMTAEQYESYLNDQYGTEDDYLMATDTDTDNN